MSEKVMGPEQFDTVLTITDIVLCIVDLGLLAVLFWRDRPRKAPAPFRSRIRPNRRRRG